ncbi:acyltransferase [Pendulispora rubella]|uniref:Acyltransferase n=1 Tax=Pendulispora rubella TaxID=2741070 RepID=A0ABZ2L6T4_9BACT
MAATTKTYNTRSDALDGLRAIAALLVAFYHCGAEFRSSPLVIPGFTGVLIFFVLSGYLVSKPFVQALAAGTSLPLLSSYAIRRFLRIYPPYLGALIFFTALRYATHLHPPSASAFTAHALLYFNFMGGHSFFDINAAFWSLSIEAQFYVLLPMSAWLVARVVGTRHAALALILLFVGVGLVSRVLEFTYPVAGNESHFVLPTSFLDLFGVGMLVAYVEPRAAITFSRSPRQRGVLWLIGIGVFLAANHWCLYDAGRADYLRTDIFSYATLYPLVCCLGAGVAVLAICVQPADTKLPILSWRPLVAIGHISYSVYLYHVAVQLAFFAALPHLPRGYELYLTSHHWLTGFLTLPFVLVTSAIAYRLVELPTMRYGTIWSKAVVQRAAIARPG